MVCANVLIFCLLEKNAVLVLGISEQGYERRGEAKRKKEILKDSS